MVWAARLRGTRGFQKIVAIKTLLPSMASDPQFEQMFLDEAALASRIRHPNVVEVLDLGEQGGVLYQVMEWVDGETLRAIMKASARAKRRVPPGIAVRLAIQACAGLHAAHQLKDDEGQLLGLIHRDISPQNILVTRGGVAKVADFGIAKLTRQGVQTDNNMIKGKVGYMAPEQVIGESLDHRIDIFTLGVVLYELTTGKHPFRGENDVATAANVCTKELAPPDKIVSDYPPLLAKVVTRALEKRREDRFATANEMLRALDQALPPGKRVITDDEVAAYVNELIVDKQGPVLAAAVRAADEEEESSLRSTNVVFNETAMLDEMQGFGGSVRTSATLSSSDLGSVLASESIIQAAPPRRPLAAGLLGAFLALGAAGVILLVIILRASKAETGPPMTRTETTAPAPSSSQAVPATEPSATSPTPQNPVASATGSATGTTSRTRAPAPKPAAVARPTAKPHASGNATSAYASPITNPGF